VAKRLTGTYQPGRRSRDWIKVVLASRDEFVIGGWLPGEGNREGRIGSLLLGRHDGPGGDLVYVGNVGTGFTGAMLTHLAGVLGPLRRASSPFARGAPKRGSVFVEPVLVAEVEYRERTRDGILRHPSFKGLRPDKTPADATDRPWVHQGDEA
jgi:bifunctional non-homologous end joining protein LigD